MSTHNTKAEGPRPAVVGGNPAVQSYYENMELRVGYWLVQGGPRHLGYWERDTWWPFPVSASLRRMEQVMLDRLDLPKGASVLDAGCGSAEVAVYMAQRGGIHVQGIDVVERHVEQAQRTIARAGLHGQVEVRLGDYHDLDWIPDESLDGIYTIEALNHATDLERVLRNFHRILKPGGRAVLHDYELSSEPPAEGGPGGNTSLKKNAAAAAAAAAPGAAPRDQQHQHQHQPPVTMLRPEKLRRALGDAGFEGAGDARDLSANVRPLLRLLYWLAVVPYLVGGLLRLRGRMPHTTIAVNGLQDQHLWRYASLRVTKPGRLVVGESGKTK